MLKTWTDTHYRLEDQDWLYIAKHEEQGAVSLVCPGYARDGEGFSIHFSAAHIEMLEHLLAALRNLRAQQDAAPGDRQELVEMYPVCDSGKVSEQQTAGGQETGYKYPDPRVNRHVIR